MFKWVNFWRAWILYCCTNVTPSAAQFPLIATPKRIPMSKWMRRRIRPRDLLKLHFWIGPRTILPASDWDSTQLYQSQTSFVVHGRLALMHRQPFWIKRLALWKAILRRHSNVKNLASCLAMYEAMYEAMYNVDWSSLEKNLGLTRNFKNVKLDVRYLE